MSMYSNYIKALTFENVGPPPRLLPVLGWRALKDGGC